MREDTDKPQSEYRELESEAKPASASTSGATASSSTTSSTLALDQLIPEGYVATATLLTPTNNQGTTSIQLDIGDHPFETHDALAAQRFTQGDVGKKIACVRLAGTQSLMILGFWLQKQGASQTTLLEGLLNQSQPTDSAAQTSANNTKKLSPKQQPKSDRVAKEIELDLENVVSAEFPPSTNQDQGEQNVFDDVDYQTADDIDGKMANEVPDHLVLQAGQSVTIKCGESSLTLGADGRIKINGRNIFSRASQLQRISGGAIKLN